MYPQIRRPHLVFHPAEEEAWPATVRGEGFIVEFQTRLEVERIRGDRAVRRRFGNAIRSEAVRLRQLLRGIGGMVCFCLMGIDIEMRSRGLFCGDLGS